MLQEDGGNYSSWADALSTKLRTDYGVAGAFIETGSLQSIEQPSMASVQRTFPFLKTESDRTSVLIKATQDYLTAMKEEARANTSMRGLVEATICKAAWEKIQMEPDFIISRETNNPLLLYQIARRVTAMNLQGSSGPEAVYFAMKRYHSIAMGPTVSILQYKILFKLAVENIANLGASIPSEVEQARNFLMSLDPLRYSEFVRYVVQMERSHPPSSVVIPSNPDMPGPRIISVDVSNFPQNIQAVIDQAQSFVLRPVSRTETIRPTVYTTEVVCHNCKKIGHYARDCKLPDRRKDKDTPPDSKALASATPEKSSIVPSGVADVRNERNEKKSKKKSKPKSIYINEVDPFRKISGFTVCVSSLQTTKRGTFLTLTNNNNDRLQASNLL